MVETKLDSMIPYMKFLIECIVVMHVISFFFSIDYGIGIGYIKLVDLFMYSVTVRSGQKNRMSDFFLP